ncbi:unnamed protein product [Closterium sp. NIES-53]
MLLESDKRAAALALVQQGCYSRSYSAACYSSTNGGYSSSSANGCHPQEGESQGVRQGGVQGGQRENGELAAEPTAVDGAEGGGGRAGGGVASVAREAAGGASCGGATSCADGISIDDMTWEEEEQEEAEEKAECGEEEKEGNVWKHESGKGGSGWEGAGEEAYRRGVFVAECRCGDIFALESQEVVEALSLEGVALGSKGLVACSGGPGMETGGGEGGAAGNVGTERQQNGGGGGEGALGEKRGEEGGVGVMGIGGVPGRDVEIVVPCCSCSLHLLVFANMNSRSLQVIIGMRNN